MQFGAGARPTPILLYSITPSPGLFEDEDDDKFEDDFNDRE